VPAGCSVDCRAQFGTRENHTPPRARPRHVLSHAEEQDPDVQRVHGKRGVTAAMAPKKVRVRRGGGFPASPASLFLARAPAMAGAASVRDVERPASRPVTESTAAGTRRETDRLWHRAFASIRTPRSDSHRSRRARTGDFAARKRHERQQTIERASVTESNHAPSACPRLTD
jgi:hypothetical protein